MDNKYGVKEVNGNDAEIPLTPGQHGLLFHALTDEGNGHYHEQFVCRFSERVDVELNMIAFVPIFLGMKGSNLVKLLIKIFNRLFMSQILVQSATKHIFHSITRFR